MEEDQPRGGGGAPWRPPPPPTAFPAEATRAAGLRPTTTHQRQQVKVKHIVTREVSTDVANFKDVVQRLTGKDSAAARAAVVAAGADGTSCWRGGAALAGRGATTSTGVVASGAAVFEDNVAGAGATTRAMFLSEDDTTWRWLRRDACE